MRVAVFVLITMVSVSADAIAQSAGAVSSPSFPNLGFEEWFASWDCFRSYVDYPTFGCDRLEIVSGDTAPEFVFAGKHSLRGSRCWWDTGFGNMARAQLVDKPYLEVTWYERSAWPVSCCGESRGSADLAFFDRSGNYMKWTWSFSTGEVAVNNWVYHRVKVPVPAGSAFVEFVVFPGINGDYYLDEVNVRQTEDAAGCIDPSNGLPCAR